MTIDEAKDLIIKAGLKLVETGLIVRTWGNISCRIDQNSFLITPSGRDYISLTPDEIVAINIDDCSYSGDVKPSSEKGIHADVYRLFPEINFVIHTHQENASIISTTGLNSIKLKDCNPYLGDEVICASYALPGTKSLRHNVSDVLLNSKGKAIIMKHHGALCIGKDYDEAFAVASELETVCHNFISNKYLELSGKDSFDSTEMNKFAISLHNKVENKINNKDFKHYPNSKRTKNGFILYYDNGKEVEIQLGHIKEFDSIEAKIYNSIYNKYEDINYILFKSTPEINTISSSGISLRPLLDDFAQIVGPLAKNVEDDPSEIIAGLKKSSAIFIQNSGALCCGKSKEDAIAIGMIIEKACKAYLGASLFGKVKPINPAESMLMRSIYLKKYSKQIDKKS